MPEEQWLDQKYDNDNLVRHPRLIGLFGLVHVDDILGCEAMDNEALFRKFVEQMKKSFTFRTWEQDSDIEYCGAKINGSTNTTTSFSTPATWLSKSPYPLRTTPMATNRSARNNERC